MSNPDRLLSRHKEAEKRAAALRENLKRRKDAGRDKNKKPVEKTEKS